MAHSDYLVNFILFGILCIGVRVLMECIRGWRKWAKTKKLRQVRQHRREQKKITT